MCLLVYLWYDICFGKPNWNLWLSRLIMFLYRCVFCLWTSNSTSWKSSRCLYMFQLNICRIFTTLDTRMGMKGRGHEHAWKDGSKNWLLLHSAFWCVIPTPDFHPKSGGCSKQMAMVLFSESRKVWIPCDRNPGPFNASIDTQGLLNPGPFNASIDTNKVYSWCESFNNSIEINWVIPRCSMVLEYLPTFTPITWSSFVGKYSSTMEHLGSIHPRFILMVSIIISYLFISI